MSNDNGGYAFPVYPRIEGLESRQLKDAAGMTLRDYFAAHCPITWEEAQNYNMHDADEMAFYCQMRLEYADAMLTERSK